MFIKKSIKVKYKVKVKVKVEDNDNENVKFKVLLSLSLLFVIASWLDSTFGSLQANLMQQKTGFSR